MLLITPIVMNLSTLRDSSPIGISPSTSRSHLRPSSAPVLPPRLWPTYAWQSLFKVPDDHHKTHDPQTKASDMISQDSSRVALGIIGDTRATVDHLGPSARWYSQATWIKNGQPSALLHLGDWVKDGQNFEEWLHVLNSLQLLGEVPLINTRGNHDRGGLYERMGFTDRPHEALSITQIGPLLIFLLDTEASTMKAREAVNQLVTYKQNNPERWDAMLKKRNIHALVWAQHRPIWSGGNHGNDERGWSSWLVPALEYIGVILCFAGHDHDYERFCESRGRVGERHCVELEKSQGVVYVISGGGASVTVPFPDLSWRASQAEIAENHEQRRMFSSAPHYIELTYIAETLPFQR